ncbi:hypothetical protein PCANC_11674 [Puccinia coronata f. sp. avenae]|uniref:Uncharacterized protein n=1 Tax=Puccinia coronata f. sp. avenae TaxID=200324 RepID=A0A2N5VXJ1_9BASI|nr:hypothetical protein PCANC_11674 [Puccinia coronata f. sp. avenae]
MVGSCQQGTSSRRIDPSWAITAIKPFKETAGSTLMQFVSLGLLCDKRAQDMGGTNLTASNAGLDGPIQVYIGCSHLIQTWAPGHRVNQTRWPNARATKFEVVNNSLGGPAPKFELDGCIQYKLGCNHPSQLFWKCLYFKKG